ncbi:hypothetical protein FPCIR_5196 [Fusarium pseudocircinatum]|uniref:Secreted RxLR effector peptide protein n=1 Tax=Fusarium pseudocircinatum TaxID=56676 RepID=A0A8H5PBB9_9HYPO|nr:hypothetical protein FPCIR_5196 [Fusarium pseudocircinatum]
MKFNLLVFTGMAVAGAILSITSTWTGARNSDVGIEAAETDDGAVPEEFLEAQKDWESRQGVKQQKKVLEYPRKGDLRSLFKYLIRKKQGGLAK